MTFLQAEVPAEVVGSALELASQWRADFSKQFAAKLAERHWLTPSWPRAYGGMESTAWQQMILAELMVTFGEPRGNQYMNVNWIGPAIILAGTPEQKSYHLSRLSRSGFISTASPAGRPCGARASPSPRPAPTSPPCEPAPSGTATSTSSTARRSGRPTRTSRSSASCWSAPIRTLSSTGASPSCWCPWTPKAWRSATSAAWSARIPSITWSSPTCAFRRRPGSARRTRGGRSCGTRWPTSASASRGTRARPPTWTGCWRRHAPAAPSIRAAQARAACEAARVLAYRVIDERAKGQGPGLNTNLARVAIISAERLVGSVAAQIAGLAGLEEGTTADQQQRNALTGGLTSGSYELQLNLIARHLGLPRS